MTQIQVFGDDPRATDKPRKKSHSSDFPRIAEQRKVRREQANARRARKQLEVNAHSEQADAHNEDSQSDPGDQ
jgi:hypothetical protein